MCVCVCVCVNRTFLQIATASGTPRLGGSMSDMRPANTRPSVGKLGLGSSAKAKSSAKPSRRLHGCAHTHMGESTQAHSGRTLAGGGGVDE